MTARMKFKLHQGDCIEVMRGLPDAIVDAVICDPPYGTTRNAWDAVIPLEPMWQELRRIVKPGGAMIFTASQPFSSALVMSNPSDFRHEWVWRKNKSTGHLNANRAPMKLHELVLVFCDRAPKYAPQMTYGHPPVNAFYTRHNGRNYGNGAMSAGGGSTQRYPTSIQDFSVVNNDDPNKRHPTQKPIELMEYMVRTYTNTSDTVLDFAMGSGSTGVACMRSGRGFIGIEIDEEQFAYAQIRIAASEPANDKEQASTL